MPRRVVFDTTTVVSALLFRGGRLAWLLAHWESGDCVPLVATATAAELTRVLAYPKFRLSAEDQRELLAQYLPFCEVVAEVSSCPIHCRDVKDQPFLDLAHTAHAELLVSGDSDLLALAGQTAFVIETPESYRSRVEML
ncbi:putative toxin-antitoxin system toxin component, PIN family [Granulicella cerasi]|uniref:Toxin-antitoxin system toxin component, PIN family n=1 Tax=Granulicella cerasi TaxID=741063 RepID=A0ABW1ZD14_9BACT|nr:putative toxin-antitoxin system toxin component, PIN family [Granulicella cerasi]